MPPVPPGKPSTWSKWYQVHKDEYNANRKKKREADPELRQKIAERQKAYRQSKPQHDPEAPRFKKVNGKTVQVFRIGEVAVACNRSIQAIRIWEREKKIPKPSVPGGHRYYTKKQLDMLVQFAELMDEVRYEPGVRAVTIERKSDEMFLNWKKP